LSAGDYRPDDLLAPAKPNESKIAEAMDFLMDLLSGGPVEQQVVRSKAAEAGVAFASPRSASGTGIARTSGTCKTLPSPPVVIASVNLKCRRALRRRWHLPGRRLHGGK